MKRHNQSKRLNDDKPRGHNGSRALKIHKLMEEISRKDAQIESLRETLKSNDTALRVSMENLAKEQVQRVQLEERIKKMQNVLTWKRGGRGQSQPTCKECEKKHEQIQLLQHRISEADRELADIWKEANKEIEELMDVVEIANLKSALDVMSKSVEQMQAQVTASVVIPRGDRCGGDVQTVQLVVDEIMLMVNGIAVESVDQEQDIMALGTVSTISDESNSLETDGNDEMKLDTELNRTRNVLLSLVSTIESESVGSNMIASHTELHQLMRKEKALSMNLMQTNAALKEKDAEIETLSHLVDDQRASMDAKDHELKQMEAALLSTESGSDMMALNAELQRVNEALKLKEEELEISLRRQSDLRELLSKATSESKAVDQRELQPESGDNVDEVTANDEDTKRGDEAELLQLQVDDAEKWLIQLLQGETERDALAAEVKRLNAALEENEVKFCAHSCSVQ